MFCRYTSLSTATQAQVLSDIVALYTGSITDKNLLSASCDKANTELITTVAGGWTVHDAAAGTNAQVLKAPIYDNVNQFKYIYISTNATSYIQFQTYETWNATTHTGTNPNQTSGANVQFRITNYTTPFILHMASSVRFAYLQTQVGTTFGSTASTAGFAFEYTRWSPWDTTAAGYMPVVCAGSTSGTPSFCRHKNNSGTDFTSSSAGSFNTPIGSAVYKVYNSAGILTIPIMSLFCSSPSNGHFGGNITEQSGVYITANSLGSTGDELTISGVTYSYQPTSGINGLIIPKV